MKCGIKGKGGKLSFQSWCHNLFKCTLYSQVIIKTWEQQEHLTMKCKKWWNHIKYENKSCFLFVVYRHLSFLSPSFSCALHPGSHTLSFLVCSPSPCWGLSLVVFLSTRLLPHIFTSNNPPLIFLLLSSCFLSITISLLSVCFALFSCLNFYFVLLSSLTRSPSSSATSSLLSFLLSPMAFFSSSSSCT